MNARFARKLEQCSTVTPNRRYSRALEESYDYWRLGRLERAWARPSITTLSGFLASEAEKTLARVAPETRILSPAMQRAAFLSVAPDQIKSPRNWYAAVAQAWSLTHHYHLRDSEDAHLQTSNTAIFEQWSIAYRALARQEHLLTEAEVAGFLAKALAEGDWVPEKSVMPWGFSKANPLSPAEAAVIESLQKNHLVSTAPQPARAAPSRTPRSLTFEQPEDELRAIALWARARLEQSKEPLAVGIAFPNLTARRQRIERSFLNLLYPDHPPSPDEPRVFDLAGGTPLLRLSACESAILLLRFLYEGISIEDFERLLESPLLQLGVRPGLAEDLRRKLPSSIRAIDFDIASNGALPQHFRRFAQPTRRRRSLSTWLAEFRKALTLAAWPRADELDSATFQHASELSQLAQQLIQASRFTAHMRVEQALEELIQAAGERHHEVRRASAPIRVLDLEEVVGLRFTHLWVAGMRNADWPPATNANPYVPRQLQRRANVPGVTPEGRLSRAKFITQALSFAAREVIISHARFENDEQHGPSALLPESIETQPTHFIPRRFRSLLGVSHPYAPTTAVRLKSITDNAGPPCDVSERGGTANLIRNHSNCSFRSFAVHRLGIDKPHQPTDLPDMRALGVAAHRALELAYRELPDQASIRNHQHLDELARRAARQAVVSELPDAPDSMCRSQQELLTKLVSAWFQCDLERPDYVDVHTEQELELEIEALPFRLKIDRFDRDLETGNWVVTDYKSSPPSPSALRDQAPLHEPQLLLYAEALRHSKRRRVVSLAFGAIGDAQEVGYRHCSADKRFRRQESDRLLDAEVLKRARYRVRSLIRSFLKGQAKVSPRRNACEGCHLHSLCRIESVRRL